MSGAEHLVSMANDIANFFHSESDRQIAVDGIVKHIQRFWDPRMRRKIAVHLAEHDGDGLNELARLAVGRLPQTPNA